MGKMMIVALFVAGCGGSSAMPAMAAGPIAADQEHAMQLVWEGVYGMTRDSRPTITWWAPCPDGAENSGCFDEYSTPGDVNLVWTGPLISDTHFSVWLEGSREWIANPPGVLSPTSEADRFTQAAQSALRDAGL